ncbi:hypothetical protein DTO207G8_1831 [Paecilomyces variotii]|nr:hypothetical protein DTO207G8_1831 [Paecilomyces variotii]KAJ9386765.1 hypothetical protein DTO063F5_3423 [Paecilomyces variotii]
MVLYESGKIISSLWLERTGHAGPAVRSSHLETMSRLERSSSYFPFFDYLRYSFLAFCQAKIVPRERPSSMVLVPGQSELS